MEQLLSIGEFAARSGLSRSALRFYDQNDLLRPQLVDEGSGYRYYAIEQLEQARMVRRLRAAEMPLGTLRAYLVAPGEQRRALLDEHVIAFRERASAVEASVEELRGELDRTDVPLSAHFCSVAPATFASALSQVSFAVADPAVRAELGAVWVETKDGSLRLVATDSYRLAIRDLVPEELGSGDIRGVIDADHVARLSTSLASARSLLLCQTELGLAATIDGHVRTVGGLGDRFPDYEQILSGIPTGHQIALPREHVERALGTLAPDAEHVVLEFGAGGLRIEAAGAHATVAGTWSGPALRMFVAQGFFTEAVQATVGPDLVIEASDPLTPITLRSADTGTFSVLTMPIRPPELA